MLILSAVHYEVFTAGALEARVRRTSAFMAPVGKNRVMYDGLYQHTRVVLYLFINTPNLKYRLITAL